MEETPTKPKRRRRKVAKNVFPRLLREMLDGAHSSEIADIVSWQPHGYSFRIHNERRFATEIAPLYFQKQTQIASFFRQLGLYGFRRMYHEGPDKDSFHHPYFVRDRPESMDMIERIPVNGRGIRLATHMYPEPDFSDYPKNNKPPPATRIPSIEQLSVRSGVVVNPGTILSSARSFILMNGVESNKEGGGGDKKPKARLTRSSSNTARKSDRIDSGRSERNTEEKGGSSLLAHLSRESWGSNEEEQNLADNLKAGPVAFNAHWGDTSTLPRKISTDVLLEMPATTNAHLARAAAARREESICECSSSDHGYMDEGIYGTFTVPSAAVLGSTNGIEEASGILHAHKNQNSIVRFGSHSKLLGYDQQLLRQRIGQQSLQYGNPNGQGRYVETHEPSRGQCIMSAVQAIDATVALEIFGNKNDKRNHNQAHSSSRTDSDNEDSYSTASFLEDVDLSSMSSSQVRFTCGESMASGDWDLDELFSDS